MSVIARPERPWQSPSVIARPEWPWQSMTPDCHVTTFLAMTNNTPSLRGPQGRGNP